MRTRVCGLAAGILAAVACGTSQLMAPPSRVSPIAFPAGNGQTDTIQAVLNQALIVRVGAGPSGQSGAHQVVRFQSVPDSGNYPAMTEPLAARSKHPARPHDRQRQGLSAGTELRLLRVFKNRVRQFVRAEG